MNWLSPLAKGGVIGVILLLLPGLTSFCQINSNTFFRLERVGLTQFDFGSARPTEKVGNPDGLEFRVGRSGDFYFVFYEDGKICRFDSGGKLIRSIPAAVPLSRRSTGFALSPEGDVFVLDGRGNYLYRYDRSLDLIGKYPLAVSKELDPIFGFAATSWGDLFVAGGLKSNVWKLEPEGQGFSARPLNLPESHRYSCLSEAEGSKLVATDPLGALMILDRFGNLLRSFIFRKGLKAAPVGENYLVTFWPNAEIMILDTVGAVLANWKAVELDSNLKKIEDFSIVQNKAYFLSPSPDKLLEYRVVPADSFVSQKGRR